MADEFTERRRLHAQRSAATGIVPFYAVFLVKDTRSRLYRIDPDGPSSWKGQVMIGAKGHRFSVVYSKADAKRMVDEYKREVAELLLDGWRPLEPLSL